MINWKKPFQLLLVLLACVFLGFSLIGCEDSNPGDDLDTTEYLKEVGTESEAQETEEKDQSKSEDGQDQKESSVHLDPDGSYTSKEDVMNYLIEYGTLPSNFITKKEAKKLGWSGNSLEPYAPGKCIGGDYFGNYEKKLPVASGLKYRECDIDTLGAKKRGAKRMIYSNDGHIYYTDDHYDTFTLLYDGEARK